MVCVLVYGEIDSWKKKNDESREEEVVRVTKPRSDNNTRILEELSEVITRSKLGEVEILGVVAEGKEKKKKKERGKDFTEEG